MNRVVKMFNVILCSVMILYAQSPTFTFTEEEVIELYNKITELEHAHTSDSLIVNNLEEQIQLYLEQTSIDSVIIENYKEQLKLKEDLIKELKPKWYDNKYLWYSMGIASMVVPIWAVGQIK